MTTPLLNEEFRTAKERVYATKRSSRQSRQRDSSASEARSGCAGCADAEDVHNMLGLAESVGRSRLARPRLHLLGVNLDRRSAAQTNEVVMVVITRAGAIQILALGREQGIHSALANHVGQCSVNSGQTDRRAGVAHSAKERLGTDETMHLSQFGDDGFALPGVSLHEALTR